MAVSSSLLAAQNSTAEAIPSVTQVKPDVQFSGSDCKIMTVTLEKLTTYLDPSTGHLDRLRKRKMQKKFTFDCDTPGKIDIEILEGITTGIIASPPSSPTTLNTAFKISINPALRNRGLKTHPNSIANTNVYNPEIFIGSSTGMLKEEDFVIVTKPSSPFEAYKLPIYNFTQSRYEIYAKSNTVPLFETINRFITERNKNNTQWINPTIGSLLTDLLENTPANFLKLIIVGNHQIIDNAGNPDITRLLQNDQATPFSFTPTGFLPDDVEKDIEAKWNQFLIARATKLRDYIFVDPSNLNIEVLPAQKINEGSTPKIYNNGNNTYNLNSSDDSIDTVYESALSNRFKDSTGVTSITQLDALNLRKGTFPAGAIFLWDSLCPGRLQLTGVKFLSSNSDVYPSLTGNPSQDREIQTIRDNNQKAFDEVRLFLSLKNSDRITTNLSALTLRVEGHTDTKGGGSANQTLSESRAQSVRTELENSTPVIPWPAGVTEPVNSSIFDSVLGFGETRLKVFTPDNTDNQENRRVEFRIISITC